MRILLIGDQSLAESLQPALDRGGMSADVADAIDQADFRLQAGSCEVAVLDQDSVPGADACLARWRREGVSADLLVVLPRGASAARRAACLDAGADVCLTHPLNDEELLAHLRSLRRRHEAAPPPAVRHVHDLEINVGARTVRRAGQPIPLRPREFGLLQLLATRPGRVFTRAAILDHLYGASDAPHSNVVEVCVRQLRIKIDRCFGRPLILTSWGSGYLLRADGA